MPSRVKVCAVASMAADASGAKSRAWRADAHGIPRSHLVTRGGRTLGVNAPIAPSVGRDDRAATAHRPRRRGPGRRPPRQPGWQIVERNARTRFGELDIVALDGRTLVFVEVKAGRAGSAFGPERPVLGVDRRKQLRVRRLATAWMSERRDAPRYAEIRFDAIGVTFDRRPGMTSSTWSARSDEAVRRRACVLHASAEDAESVELPRPAARRPTGTSDGAGARCRSARSPRGARGSSSRRAPRSPSRDGRAAAPCM